MTESPSSSLALAVTVRVDSEVTPLEGLMVGVVSAGGLLSMVTLASPGSPSP